MIIMGKKLDAQIKQQKVYHRNKRLEAYKSPFDCPKCSAPQQLRINKYKSEDKTNFWFAKCGVCGMNKSIEMLNLYVEIDAYNIVCDLIKKGEL